MKVTPTERRLNLPRSYATSTITMRYGCGHELTVTNGDIMWPSCPWCSPVFRRLWGSLPEPRRVAA